MASIWSRLPTQLTMKTNKTTIQDAFLIEAPAFGDERGKFSENYHQLRYQQLGLTQDFVQDNFSFSQYGTIRGLHFQTGDYAQSKLVRVIQGKIIDVIIDLRKDSASYQQVYQVELSQENNLQLLAPKGVAHGFSALADHTIVYYKCDQFYHPESEAGIHPLDDSLAIDWGVSEQKRILSAKDLKHPTLSEYLERESLA